MSSLDLLLNKFAALTSNATGPVPAPMMSVAPSKSKAIDFAAKLIQYCHEANNILNSIPDANAYKASLQDRLSEIYSSTPEKLEYYGFVGNWSSLIEGVVLAINKVLVNTRSASSGKEKYAKMYDLMKEVYYSIKSQGFTAVKNLPNLTFDVKLPAKKEAPKLSEWGDYPSDTKPTSPGTIPEFETPLKSLVKDRKVNNFDFEDLIGKPKSVKDEIEKVLSRPTISPGTIPEFENPLKSASLKLLINKYSTYNPDYNHDVGSTEIFLSKIRDAFKSEYKGTAGLFDSEDSEHLYHKCLPQIKKQYADLYKQVCERDDEPVDTQVLDCLK